MMSHFVYTNTWQIIGLTIATSASNYTSTSHYREENGYM